MGGRVVLYTKARSVIPEMASQIPSRMTFLTIEEDKVEVIASILGATEKGMEDFARRLNFEEFESNAGRFLGIRAWFSKQ
jgi:hypothetical protein